MEEGQRRDTTPFFLPENAFFSLEDAIVWRGRIRKRFGSSFLGDNYLNSTLRLSVGTTDGSGNLSETIPGDRFKVGQIFSIGKEIFTLNKLGSPENLLISEGATGATFNVTTKELIITGASISTVCYFYPKEPVMGLISREEEGVSLKGLVAFDTQFSYEFLSEAWERLGTEVWTGQDTNFFWGKNYRGANPYETYLYVVNNSDNIRYLPEGSSSWATLAPVLNPTGTSRILKTCLILIPFKDRLIALNTTETENGIDRAYINRCRFSVNGNPINEQTSWIEKIGSGGFIDAPTKERIVSAGPLRDQIVVYFENSTWVLVYTQSPLIPFKWKNIDKELGSIGPFSVIDVDPGVLGIGTVGVHACDGNSVQRIDKKIPNEVFDVNLKFDGGNRIYGKRDFNSEVIYWSFPDQSSEFLYPTKVLVYNYANDTWSIYNDSFTCFGDYKRDLGITWENLQYESWTVWNTPWSTPSVSEIIAGNPQGTVCVLDKGKTSNTQMLYITDALTNTSELIVIDHSLSEGSYILIEGAIGITLNDIIVQVDQVSDSNTIIIDTKFTGVYKGGGKITRISNLKILTKQYNPSTETGQQFLVPYMDFLFDRTEAGEISLDYFSDTTAGNSMHSSSVPGALFGSNILSTRPDNFRISQESRSQIWHRYHMLFQGQFLQLLFFMNDRQMRDISISRSEIVLHAMILYAEVSGVLIK